MDRAEAIKFFERHMKEDILRYGEREAIQVAIAALREQEEMVRTIARLQSRLSDAENCIWAIEDALNRGNDNDWAREAIEGYENALKEGADHE